LHLCRNRSKTPDNQRASRPRKPIVLENECGAKAILGDRRPASRAIPYQLNTNMVHARGTLRLRRLPAVGVAAIAVAEGSSSVLAATHSAASGSQADVQAALDAASGGDIVRLLAGTATWSSDLSISKGMQM